MYGHNLSCKAMELANSLIEQLWPLIFPLGWYSEVVVKMRRKCLESNTSLDIYL